jgi:Peptidase family M28
MTRVRDDVRALAGIERRSASAGERRSAEWCARRLAEAGAVDVTIEPFRYQHSFGSAHALHFATAALGRLPARGERTRTLVLVAHHDAAHTGLMWHPALAGAGASDRGRPPFSLLPELAMAAIALGPRRARLAGRLLLALAAGLSLQVTCGATVPGASDNATGVAAVLALVGRLVAERPPGLEVLAVLTGAEESGMGGMSAWLREARPRLDRESTLVLGLDTLGAGEPMVARAEGPLWRVRYAPEDLALADAAARRAGLRPPRRFRLGGWTDPALARIAGLRTISLLSLRGRGFTDYHLPTDTPDRVDWDSVERCLALAEAIGRTWGSR